MCYGSPEVSEEDTEEEPATPPFCSSREEAVEYLLNSFWERLLEPTYEYTEDLNEVTGTRLEDMFGPVDSVSEALLLPHQVRNWAHRCSEIYCAVGCNWQNREAVREFADLILYNCGQENEGKPLVLRRLDGEDGTEYWLEPQDVFDCFVGETEHQVWWEFSHCRNYSESDSELEHEGTGYSECELEEDFSEEIDDNSENKESSEHEPEESFSGGADDPAESKENRSYGSELSSPLQDVGPLESPDAFSFTAPVPVTAHSLSVTAHSQSRWCRYGTRCWRHKKGQCHFRHK